MSYLIYSINMKLNHLIKKFKISMKTFSKPKDYQV